MIVITGAAGFIGSCLLTNVLAENNEEVVLVDDFSRNDRQSNYSDKQYAYVLHRDQLEEWLKQNAKSVSVIYHLGARTDTAELNVELFNALNLNYSKMLWSYCVKHDIRFVYASSAATYGDGSLGFDDNHDVVENLKPLNPYGDSKNDFDKWVLTQTVKPTHWYGLKFFNVYGPNEYHKGRMASVIFHANKQIKETGKMKMFRSHRSDYKDGEQSRDFIYVKDVIKICTWLPKSIAPSGIYNVGTGKARTFCDLVKSTFSAMQIEENIEFIDTPFDIRETYQYFTEANMSKIKKVGYNIPFTSLEDGVREYVSIYLAKSAYY